MRRGKEGEKREKGEKVGSVHSLEMEVVALIGHRGAEMVDTVGHHVATTGHYLILLLLLLANAGHNIATAGHWLTILDTLWDTGDHRVGRCGGHQRRGGHNLSEVSHLTWSPLQYIEQPVLEELLIERSWDFHREKRD